MFMYGYIPKYIPLNKIEILKRIKEEEIFSYILNQSNKAIDLDQKYLAPYRDDNNAGCFFSFYNDTLYFVDFANEQTHLSCFDLFMKVYKCDYNEALKKINSIFNLGLEYEKGNKEPIFEVKQNKDTFIHKEKENTKFQCYLREYNNIDLIFWKSYGITKEQLISDKVYPIIAFKSVKNGKLYIVNNLKQSYVFSDFNNNKLKIYSPHSKYKWITNLTQDDVGNINNLPKSGDTLIITKSYKDCRVLRNLGYESIWFQNERVIPSNKILIDLLQRFKNIYIFFDNDSTGLSHTKTVIEKLKSFNSKNNIKNILIPPVLLREENIKDISDYFKIKGNIETVNFLKNNIK